MKRLIVLILAAIVAGCGDETSRPFNHANGMITVEGTDFHSALIIQRKAGGVHAVGGFLSDAPLGKITIGPNNSQAADLQIIPSQGIVIRHGKKHKVENDGYLIWIIGGKVYEQNLNGFPLETNLEIPKEVSNKQDVSASKAPQSPNKSPFQSIMLGDNAIVATLPKIPRWRVTVESDEPRLSKPNEAFTLKPGESLELVERHSRYRVTAELSPRQGLVIESRFDGRSFGDEVSTKKYFLPVEAGKQDGSR